MTAAAMTAATITDVMLPSFATMLHELAFQIETVVFRICGTASGMDLHGSPRLDKRGTRVPSLGCWTRVEQGSLATMLFTLQ